MKNVFESYLNREGAGLVAFAAADWLILFT